MTEFCTKPRLIGDRVILRAPCDADAQDRFELGRTAEIVHMLGGDASAMQPLTLDVAQDWVAKLAAFPTAWIIEVAGRCVGSVRLHSVNEVDHRAILAIGIHDPDLLGQGIGQEAMTLILTHAFDTMGLHRVSLRVLEYNHRAIAAYKKVGFVEEGREREAGLVQGKRYDDLIMGVLAHEYQPLGGAI